MNQFFQFEAVRFACTGCGKCCTGDANYHVFLTTDEAKKIQLALEVSWDWFRRRYLQKHRESGRWNLKAGKNPSACVFLLPNGSCKVYSSRPLQCKTYPFWPEIMISRSAWHAEAKRCEGINRGNRVDPKIIRSTLELVNQYDNQDE